MIIYIAMIWCALVLVGFILYLFRDDFTEFLNDIEKLINKSILSLILTVFALFVFFPISIPFTIYHLYKSNESVKNNGRGFR